MFLVPLLFIIVLIWLIAYFVRSSQYTPPANTAPRNNASSNKAMEVLKERYARGEISEEEFFKIKRTLE